MVRAMMESSLVVLVSVRIRGAKQYTPPVSKQH